MRPGKEIRTPKAVIYTPFPSIDEEDYQAYNEFLNKIFDNKTGTKKVNGLQLRYDNEARMASWEGYRKHVEELEKFKEIHKKVFNMQFKTKNLNYQYEEAYNPIDLENTKTPVEKIFEDYDQNDILFIHSHGNTEVIGTGGFILTPSMLAQNLKQLGLSKSNPPLIVVWACNSGTEELNCQSYADDLRENLKSKNFNFENVCVFGVAASIELNPKGKKPNTLVTFEGQSISEVLKIYASPSPKEQFKEIEGDNGELWTQISNFKAARSRLNSESDKIAKKLDFDNLPETPKIKTKKSRSVSSGLSVRVKRSGTQLFDTPQEGVTSPKSFIELQQEFQKKAEQDKKRLQTEVKNAAISSSTSESESEGSHIIKNLFINKPPSSPTLTRRAQVNENQKNTFLKDIKGQDNKNDDNSTPKNRK